MFKFLVGEEKFDYGSESMWALSLSFNLLKHAAVELQTCS